MSPKKESKKKSEHQTQAASVSFPATPATPETATTSNNVDSNSNSSFVLVTTGAELEQLLGGERAKVILIEFFAEWCAPCKLLAKQLDDWSKIYDVIVAQIDVDNLEEIAVEYNVIGVPTLAFIKDKQKLEQLEGSNVEKIVAALEKHCKRLNTEK